MYRIIIMLTIALAVLCLTSTLSAGIKDWSNPLGGNWFLATNWSQSQIPQGTDTVNITLAGTYVVTIDSNNASVIRLVLGGSSGTQTLRLLSPSSYGVYPKNWTVGSVTLVPGGGFDFVFV
jgi:hypothetical protein